MVVVVVMVMVMVVVMVVVVVMAMFVVMVVIMAMVMVTVMPIDAYSLFTWSLSCITYPTIKVHGVIFTQQGIYLLRSHNDLLT